MDLVDGRHWLTGKATDNAVESIDTARFQQTMPMKKNLREPAL